MTKDFPLKATIGDLYDPAMKIRTKAAAKAYFERLVAYGMKHGQTREKAAAIQRANLGYYAGYYDAATRERVERLFSCAHPIFGAIAERGSPTPEEAFAAGRAMGEKA